MALRSQRVLKTFLAGGDARRPEMEQRETIKITLAPEPGVIPSEEPPVRIYVGTESAQFRAERVFIWSIQRVRDPARCYEIHLMKDFAGFERRLWLTGFTNYRFVIPELAGSEGRAIYNDTDQIYLQDPAILFDTPMCEHGVLSINDHDTSVMLMDCAKMVGLWNWESAKTTRNRQLEQQMRDVPGLWGTADGAWNARDAEYVPGESAVVHYTTIHTQPWRPFPQDYVYQANPASEVWLSIEHEADEQGFQLFDAHNPSPAFAQSVRSASAKNYSAFAGDNRRLLKDAQAKSAAAVGINVSTCAPMQGFESLASGALRYTDIRPEAGAEEKQVAKVDVSVVTDLEQLPDLDIPWILDEQFEHAQSAVLVCIDLTDGKLAYCPADPLWWYAQLAAAGVRQSHKHWRLVVRQPRLGLDAKVHRWSGGALLHESPTTWALLHYKSGHASQTLGIADALGWDYSIKNMDYPMWRYLAAAALNRIKPGAARMPGNIAAPWPEVVIASGWLPALVARWIVRQNLGNTRLVLMGRRGGPVGEAQHIALHCEHFGLPPHPQHIATVLPPNKVNAERINAAATRWSQLYGDTSRPHIALLVGGDNAQCSFNAVTARKLGEQIREATEEAGGQLAVLPSRRTTEEASAALRMAAGEAAQFVPASQASQEVNPYLGYLAMADILVVTGESESMLAEAVATGKPVYIYPLPASEPSLRQRLADWVYHQARTDRFNKRGSRRPQEGLQYLCARLVEHRILLPRRQLEQLHKALVDNNVARFLEGPLEAWQPAHWQELESVAERIRTLLVPTVSSDKPSVRNPDRRAANA